MTLDDPGRLAAVAASGRADGSADERLTKIARHTAQALGCAVGLVTLVGTEQAHAGRYGTDMPTLPRTESCCAEAIARGETYVVTDLRADPRWADGRVVGELGMAFYAGRPLAAPGGELVGALCVLDPRPRPETPELRATLDDLAAWAELELASAARAEELGVLQDRLVSSAAHELRTPLVGVRSHAELLLDDPELPEPVRRSLEAILAGAHQLQRGTDAVVATLREEAGAAEVAVRRRLGL